LAGWPLRRRLLAAVLALFAVVCLVIGVTSTLALRTFLVGQLDRQLQSTAERAGRPPGGGPRPPDLFTPGQPPGTVGVRIFNGTVTEAAILDPTAEGYRTDLGPEQASAAAAVPVNGAPQTVNLGEHGDYRMVARSQPGGAVLVTGLPLAGVENTVWQLILIEAAVTAVALLVAGLAGTAIVRLTLRPLRRVAATAARVAELPLAQGEVSLSERVPEADTDPRTEVGQVGSALNRLLDHVGGALAARHASETRVRQFVADASHELRTPLAAIRGYAELTRRSRDAVPADIVHAMGRVESESARMTTLVDDLLLLARLDSGRPLEREQVELSGLVVDAVNDAHAAGPEHRWLLDLPDEPVTAPGDAARLLQVLGNLLANARTHTPAGTKVTVQLATTVDGWAVVSVVDNGPGVSPTLLPDIFERFARGDSSRSRAAGSTGLGLSIVAAVVAAHGGRVDVASRPGETTFAVRLPGATRSADPR
jgi:two-component system OmpR family sensor kinase